MRVTLEFVDTNDKNTTVTLETERKTSYDELVKAAQNQMDFILTSTEAKEKNPF